ncbi:hypothetical protein Trydic_g7958 [Trypoxylus dichotomus]
MEYRTRIFQSLDRTRCTIAPDNWIYIVRRGSVQDDCKGNSGRRSVRSEAAMVATPTKSTHRLSLETNISQRLCSSSGSNLRQQTLQPETFAALHHSHHR